MKVDKHRQGPFNQPLHWGGLVAPVCGTLTGETVPALDWQSTLVDTEQSYSTAAALMSFPFLSIDGRIQGVTPKRSGHLFDNN